MLDPEAVDIICGNSIARFRHPDMAYFKDVSGIGVGVMTDMHLDITSGSLSFVGELVGERHKHRILEGDDIPVRPPTNQLPFYPSVCSDWLRIFLTK